VSLVVRDGNARPILKSDKSSLKSIPNFVEAFREEPRQGQYSAIRRCSSSALPDSSFAMRLRLGGGGGFPRPTRRGLSIRPGEPRNQRGIFPPCFSSCSGDHWTELEPVTVGVESGGLRPARSCFAILRHLESSGNLDAIAGKVSTRLAMSPALSRRWHVRKSRHPNPDPLPSETRTPAGRRFPLPQAGEFSGIRRLREGEQ